MDMRDSMSSVKVSQTLGLERIMDKVLKYCYITRLKGEVHRLRDPVSSLPFSARASSHNLALIF